MMDGKKTYTVAAILIVIAVAQHFGIEVPQEVLTAVGGAGLAALRHSVK